MEDLWFGPWKHLLLGQVSDHNKQIDFLPKKLMKDLKSKCKIDVDEDIIKALIRGGVQQKECLSELLVKNGCYIGGRECLNDGNLSSFASEALLNAMHEIGQECFVDREPVILVTEFDLHMLPWESLPVLRNQEVYRMPSVFSISWTYDKCCRFQEKDGKYSSLCPVVDPLDAYYLLNLGGNLREADFGNWFKDKILEGTSGTSPSADELSTALKDHDLFIYLGHGNGLQYIPGPKIQKLDRCAAALLMGCSSGSLLLDGSYIPKGAPLYYLSAGSPVIIATLWEVVLKDIELFGKSVFDKWINAGHCSQCTRKMNIVGERKTKGGMKIRKRKYCEVDSRTADCKHMPKIGFYVGQSRRECALRFLTSAAIVCYGVPTGVQTKGKMTKIPQDLTSDFNGKNGYKSIHNGATGYGLGVLLVVANLLSLIPWLCRKASFKHKANLNLVNGHKSRLACHHAAYMLKG